MKKFQKIIVAFILMGIVGACTSDFDEINKNPTKVSEDQASAAYFLTKPQYELYAPNRFPYWRAQLIHGDRYAGYFTFGFTGSWWGDGLCYTYNSGYTDASFEWLENLYGSLQIFNTLTAVGGDLENERMYAIGLIMKGLYFQTFTDIFGELPYTEIDGASADIPSFDTQDTIYKGVIAQLDEAMSIIGDFETTGDGTQDIGLNDLYYSGDLQKWKRFANTLKLRMAMRAYGAPNSDFATTAISEALANPLLGAGDDAFLNKDNVISQWASAAYGDVWHNFGGNGSKWRVGKHMIDYLQNNNDPRLSAYANPAAGGTFRIPVAKDATEQKMLDTMLQNLDDAGVTYSVADVTEGDDDFKEVTMPENAVYVGQPTRLSDFSYDFAHGNFFSTPADLVVKAKNDGDIFKEIVFTAAESYFLQAEAAARGLSAGDANALYQSGIRQAMAVWGVAEADVDIYITNEAVATLSGSMDQMLEQIGTQKWVALYTDGFEGWANVRKSGYPADLAAGITDNDVFNPGSINGLYPTRMRYGNSIRNTNGTNLDAAIARQGPDKQDTKLWWAK